MTPMKIHNKILEQFCYNNCLVNFYENGKFEKSYLLFASNFFNNKVSHAINK